MKEVLLIIGRRILLVPIMLLGVTLLVFALSNLSPIDEATQVLGDSAPPEKIEQYNEEHGLNDPFIVRYVSYIGSALQGDFGTYGAKGDAVSRRISRALPITLQLSCLGLIFAIIFSLILGIISAVYRNKWPDHLIRIVSMAFIAMPSFWLAVLLILVFSSNLHILPSSGHLSHFTHNPTDWFLRMLLPSIALSVPLTGQFCRLIRASMVEEFDKDYVKTAIGSGLSPFVVVKNVLRNALIVPVTSLGVRIGALIGGAVVIEVIFNLPGMGMTILLAIQSNFTYLLQACVLVVAVAFVVINTVVDILYILIDPKIRAK